MIMRSYLVRFGRPSKDVTVSFSVVAESEISARIVAKRIAAENGITERLTEIRAGKEYGPTFSLLDRAEELAKSNKENSPRPNHASGLR